MLELRLYFKEGDREKTVTATKDEFIIGRSPECDLQLPYNAISRHHCRFLKNDEGNWIIEDMGSKNQTILNNNPIATRKTIKQGDVVKIDNILLNVVLVESPSPTPKLASTLTSAPTLTPNLSSPPKAKPVNQELTLIGNAEKFQKQWIEAQTKTENLSNYRKAIDRLQDLVEIAKFLSSAESIEEIFARVQEIVLRELTMLDRLALLVDIEGNGELELIHSTTRQNNNFASDGSWISATICKEVFDEKVAIKTADAQTDARFEGEMTIVNKGIRSALAVPLLDKNRVCGVLYGDALISYESWQRGGDEDLSFFSAIGNLVASSVQRWLLSRKLRGEEIVRQKLERYHSPGVVQQLLKAELSGKSLAPTESEISILFADIVAFTELSERLTPPRISELLNNFFEEMLQEVFQVGGTLDKFIGDCIMAFFGAPEPQEDHAERAVIAAKRMLARLEVLNDENTLGEILQLRISINSGKAIVGDVGSSQRVDYTVLGPTINLAARMEPICPPGNCVISENTYNLLRSPSSWELMGEQRFRGIDRPVRIYKIG